MSEYQEALDTLVRYAHESPNVGWVLIHKVNILQKLLDKETPMRVTKNIECPVCGMYAQRVCRGVHTPAKRCINEDCNQKLDWSVDDD